MSTLKINSLTYLKMPSKSASDDFGYSATAQNYCLGIAAFRSSISLVTSTTSVLLSFLLWDQLYDNLFALSYSNILKLNEFVNLSSEIAKKVPLVINTHSNPTYWL